TGHVARDCPKNSRNGDEGSGNDKQAATKGRVFDSTANRATSAPGSVWMHPRPSVLFCSVLFCLVNDECVQYTPFRFSCQARPMVNTRQSTPKFSGPAFDEAVQRAVKALLPGLKTQLTNELLQNGAGSSGEQSPTIHTWLERFGKQKPRSFSFATTPVDAEDWIAHIEKLFEVLGCTDEFKARMTSYKFEGDALNWWKAFKKAKGGEAYVATLSWKDFREIFFLQYFPRSEQQKYERKYHTIRQKDGELTGDFMKRFLRLAGFVGEKAGPPEEQAKHFKWALSTWIL
ncbi:putative reverse transcriptase domain-containing protein, partial [Tanacetum coccineum]